MADTYEVQEFIVKMIENHFGSPIEHVTVPEIEKWVRNYCIDPDGDFLPLRFKAVMEVLA